MSVCSNKNQVVAVAALVSNHASLYHLPIPNSHPRVYMQALFISLGVW